MQKIEHLIPLYLEADFSQRAKLLLGHKVYRVEIGAGRHYRLEDGRTFRSLTTFLSLVLSKSQVLNDWRENLAADLGSKSAADEYVEATADYGTALHIAVAEYCRNGFVVWADFEDWAGKYLAEMGLLGETFHSALERLIKDFAAIVEFFHDYNVEVIAVELPVWLDDGIATLIDLVVKMDIKKYDKTEPDKRKRITAAINLKSGSKGFWEEHLFQLEGERRMLNAMYAAHLGPVTTVYNLAPKAWHSRPTYKLKDQTPDIEAQEIPAQFELYLKLGKIRGVLKAPKKDFTVFAGKTSFGESAVGAMLVLNYDQYADKRVKEHQQRLADQQDAALLALSQ